MRKMRVQAEARQHGFFRQWMQSVATIVLSKPRLSFCAECKHHGAGDRYHWSKQLLHFAILGAHVKFAESSLPEHAYLDN